MSLHPEILALIEAGPQQVAIGKDGIGVESYAMFARRIALRAVELEREGWVKECAAMVARHCACEYCGALVADLAKHDCGQT